MPDRSEPPEDGRTPEERQMDKALKATFPASDPPAFSSGTATPASPEHGGEDEDEEDEQARGR
jgi:hypothetical protein